MSNTIKVKRGAAAPTTSNLEEYELGYSTNEKNLYIRDGNEMIRLSSHIRVLPLHEGINIRYFIEDNSDELMINYPYSYTLTVEGVKETEIPIVIFRPDTSIELSFFCETKNDAIIFHINDNSDLTQKIELMYVILVDSE